MNRKIIILIILFTTFQIKTVQHMRKLLSIGSKHMHLVSAKILGDYTPLLASSLTQKKQNFENFIMQIWMSDNESQIHDIVNLGLRTPLKLNKVNATPLVKHLYTLCNQPIVYNEGDSAFKKTKAFLYSLSTDQLENLKSDSITTISRLHANSGVIKNYCTSHDNLSLEVKYTLFNYLKKTQEEKQSYTQMLEYIQEELDNRFNSGFLKLYAHTLQRHDTKSLWHSTTRVFDTSHNFYNHGISGYNEGSIAAVQRIIASRKNLNDSHSQYKNEN